MYDVTLKFHVKVPFPKLELIVGIILKLEHPEILVPFTSNLHSSSCISNLKWLIGTLYPLSIFMEAFNVILSPLFTLLSSGVMPFSFFRGISIDEDYIIEQTGAVSDYNKVRDMDDGDVYGWAIDGKDERRLKYETVYPRSFFKRLKGLLSLQIEITNPGKVLPSINLQRLTKENVELQPKKAELIAMYSYDLNTRYGNYVPKGFIDINRGIANLMENERIRDNIHFSRRFLSD